MKCAGVVALLALGFLTACGKATLPPIPPADMASPPCEDVAPLGFPGLSESTESRASKKKKKGTLGFLCRKGQYAIGYDTALRAPRWVIEVIDPSRFQGTPQRVRKDWREDPFVPQSSRVSVKDYSREITGEKIGVKSMASYKNVAASEVMVGRTFYLSNTLPAFLRDQEPGAWEKLEDQVISWSSGKGRLLVVSGPIFANGTPLGWMGLKSKKRRAEPRGDVAIPTHFYKVVVDEKTQQGIAFIIPNNDPPAEDLPLMAKKISDVERIAGINFFPRLQEESRGQLTSNANPALWPIK